MEDKQLSLVKLKELVSSIPKPNFHLLTRLMCLFKNITQNVEITRMGASNLAVSFGMNLLQVKQEDPAAIARHVGAINKLCEILILNSDYLLHGIVTNEANNSTPPKAEADDKTNETNNSISPESDDTANEANNLAPPVTESDDTTNGELTNRLSNAGNRNYLYSFSCDSNTAVILDVSW